MFSDWEIVTNGVSVLPTAHMALIWMSEPSEIYLNSLMMQG